MLPLEKTLEGHWMVHQIKKKKENAEAENCKMPNGIVEVESRCITLQTEVRLTRLSEE